MLKQKIIKFLTISKYWLKICENFKKVIKGNKGNKYT